MPNPTSTEDESVDGSAELNASSHSGPPSFSPPPLPTNVLSESLATNVQDKEAFTEMNGYNSKESNETVPNKLTNGDISHSESGKENLSATSPELPVDTNESVKETKSKRRFMGKRVRPRKKSNANADQVKAFENKIKGCHK